MYLKYFFLCFLFYFYQQMNQCCSESIKYISLERAVLEWYDTRYMNNVTFTSKRHSRRDPQYYVDIHGEALVVVNNSLSLDIYFYQFLTNRYRPSFVEMHFKVCDMLQSDRFFGETLRKSLKGRSCPFPPGIYEMKNMSIPYVPKGFPFTKGRIYFNMSLDIDNVSRIVARASIDMEIKTAKIKKK